MLNIFIYKNIYFNSCHNTTQNRDIANMKIPGNQKLQTQLLQKIFLTASTIIILT